MTSYLAIVGILALAIFGGYLQDSLYRRRERAADRREAAWLEERRQLLNRLMYMAKVPWEEPPPPLVEFPPPQPDEDVVDPLLEAL